MLEHCTTLRTMPHIERWTGSILPKRYKLSQAPIATTNQYHTYHMQPIWLRIGIAMVEWVLISLIQH